MTSRISGTSSEPILRNRILIRKKKNAFYEKELVRDFYIWSQKILFNLIFLKKTNRKRRIGEFRNVKNQTKRIVVKKSTQDVLRASSLSIGVKGKSGGDIF
ncbi:hypothetical protein CH380_15385 [Leptospira adleri]|uniref:Uncharacterized protein n=1 Tax=Leptospira adleri TaxID=2023186 RepID=A0A2M9YL58_9LEPT|nr:hypothetical protein CH380_15385 [Leptospira adleri]PJZ63495.1 hypothetical protein CH376_02405 [Leptospira adleri]